MKYKHLIISGEKQDLNTVQFHHSAPLDRYVLLQKDKTEGDGGIRIVTHIINSLPNTIPAYCDLHWHDFDEINLILSEDSSLKYRIRIEDETYEVDSPSTIYIPKGVKHAAEVISGKGVYVVITFTKNYQAFQ